MIKLVILWGKSWYPTHLFAGPATIKAWNSSVQWSLWLHRLPWSGTNSQLWVFHAEWWAPIFSASNFFGPVTPVLAVEASQSSPSPWYNRSNGFQWQRRLCLKMRCPKIPMIHDQNRHHLGHPTRPLDSFGPCEGHQRPHGVGVAQSCGAASGLFAVHFPVFPVTLTVNQLPKSEFHERIPCFMKRSGCAFQRTVSKYM